MSIEVKGVRRMNTKIKQFQKEQPVKLLKGLNEAADFLMERSLELCPIDTGALRDSIYKKELGTKKLPEIMVGYSEEYAGIVHENPDAFHPIGEYKFLEKPIREYRIHLIYLVEKNMQ